jgi:hypothetical protein
MSSYRQDPCAVEQCTCRGEMRRNHLEGGGRSNDSYLSEPKRG